jgi:phthalate 4,5-dioxygenase
MLTPEENELLTRVCGDAPMGRMLRKHVWIPALLSQKLVADGAPVRSRLLGEDFVAFRATDGRVGFFDEACPHRGVSLALARNEENALRCIFHGWKYDVSGRCVEVPTQPLNHDGFCAQVRLNHYPVHEAAGIVWVYLGTGDPPPFPDFEFVRFDAPSYVFPTMGVGHFNWLQAVETTMDSSHLGILHSTSIKALGDVGLTKDYTAPVYEVEQKPFGFRYASIRNMDDGRAYVRFNTFVAPWFAFIAPTINNAPGYAVQFNTPVDDEHTIFFLIEFRRTGLDLAKFPMIAHCTDPSNWPPGVPDDPSTHWGQDREAMAHGHFTGFTAHVLTEDVAVNTSMKPIVDRSKETLNLADTAIVRLRQTLLRSVREFIAGTEPAFVSQCEYPEIGAQSDVIPAGVPWREHFAPKKGERLATS